MADGIAVTFDNASNTVNIPGSGANPDFQDSIGAVFYLDDGALLPLELHTSEIYYLYNVGGDDWVLRRRPNTSLLVVGFTDDGSGQAYLTINGVNTPITSVEIDLPLAKNGPTGFSTTTINTGASEYDVKNF